MTDGFQVVKSKRPRKVKIRDGDTGACLVTDSQSCQEVDIARTVRKITESRNDLTSSEFYSSVKDLIVRVLHSEGDDKNTKVLPIQAVCYGLGNFSECIIARYQLCLLMALREHLKIDASDCHLYDPRFRDGETDILCELGFCVIDKNEEGKRPCALDTRTLFYMPHCGKSLCNNLLWANWSRRHLSNMVVIGNSFTSIINNTPSRLLEKTGGYIQRVSFQAVRNWYLIPNWGLVPKLHPYCTEVPLPTTFKFTDIFNDTSIHNFPANKLQAAPEEFWDSPSEPHYEEEDVEFIFNKQPT